MGKAIGGIFNSGLLNSNASAKQVSKILNSGWQALEMKGEWKNGQEWIVNYAAERGKKAHIIGRIENVPNSPSKEHYIYKAPNSAFYRDPLNGKNLNNPKISSKEYFFLN